MRTLSQITVAVCSLFALQVGHAFAENWPNWRGVHGNSVAAGSGYPIHWDAETNIGWTVDLVGEGSSTPVVWENNIVLTCQHGDANAVVCLDRNGQQKWLTDVGLYRAGKHRKATGANPSPVTDGKLIYCYFKSGDLACLNFAGETIWHRNLQSEFGADTLFWDLGTSPVLAGDLVIVANMQSGDSYVLAMDKQTGKQRWKVARNLPAPAEANHSYTTPCLVQIANEQQLIVLGADHFTAHALDDGREIWRVGELNPKQRPNFRSISSPVSADDLVFGCYARGGTLTAVRLGGSGDVTDSHVVWTKRGRFGDVPTPAVANQRLYVCSDRGRVLCLEPESGERIWKNQLRGRLTISASPVIAGHYMYVTTETGTTFVLDIDDEGKLVATNALEKQVIATPVFVNGQILIRTLHGLMCIAQAPT